VQHTADANEVVGKDAEGNPSLHSIKALVSASAETVSSRMVDQTCGAPTAALEGQGILHRTDENEMEMPGFDALCIGP
jgi:hypothetical protein